MTKDFTGLPLVVLLIVVTGSCHKRTERSHCGRAFYISSHASGDGDGSKDKPWRNIFVSGNHLTMGTSRNDVFAGNKWWSGSGSFSMVGIRTFDEWIKNQEKINGEVRGWNLDPGFGKSSLTDVTDPRKLRGFIKYKLPAGSSLRTSGVNLSAELGIEPGKWILISNHFRREE